MDTATGIGCTSLTIKSQYCSCSGSRCNRKNLVAVLKEFRQKTLDSEVAVPSLDSDLLPLSLPSVPPSPLSSLTFGVVGSVSGLLREFNKRAFLCYTQAYTCCRNQGRRTRAAFAKFCRNSANVWYRLDYAAQLGHSQFSIRKATHISWLKKNI